MVTQARLTVFWVVFNNGLRRCESKQKRHGLSMFKSDALTHRHTRFLYIKSTIYSLASEARPSTCTPLTLIRLFFRFWSCCQKELFNFDHFLTHILLSRRLICSVFFDKSDLEIKRAVVYLSTLSILLSPTPCTQLHHLGFIAVVSFRKCEISPIYANSYLCCISIDPSEAGPPYWSLDIKLHILLINLNSDYTHQIPVFI